MEVNAGGQWGVLLVGGVTAVREITVSCVFLYYGVMRQACSAIATMPRTMAVGVLPLPPAIS